MQMSLHNIKPELAPYIQTLCTVKWEGAGDSSAFRVLPDTCVELFVNYGKGSTLLKASDSLAVETQSFITSRMSRFIDVQVEFGVESVALCFYPGAASAFFPIAMSEVANRALQTADLWKSVAREMEEQVAEARSNSERVELVQRFLLKRLLAGESKRKSEGQRVIAHCVGEVHHHRAALSVKDLAEKVGVSQRQLVRQFQSGVGLSPKEYIRVTRFIYSLANLKNYPEANLTEIALKSGYYDQAHFVHDCRKFAGLTPKVVRSSAGTLLY